MLLPGKECFYSVCVGEATAENQLSLNNLQETTRSPLSSILTLLLEGMKPTIVRCLGSEHPLMR